VWRLKTQNLRAVEMITMPKASQREDDVFLKNVLKLNYLKTHLSSFLRRNDQMTAVASPKSKDLVNIEQQITYICHL
jgi:hypothetical protein